MKTLLLLLATLAAGNIQFSGRCPKFQPVGDFSWPQFTKHPWYVYKSYTNASQCMGIIYHDFNDGRIQYTEETQVSGARRSFARLVQRNLTDKPVGAYIAFDQAPFLIIHADYDQCAFVWQCSYDSADDFNRQSLFVLTAVRNPPSDMSCLKKGLQDIGMNTTHLKTVNQANCTVKLTKPDYSIFDRYKSKTHTKVNITQI